MKYISTRGGIEPISFKDAVMMGLASDGGLLLPNPMPSVDQETINLWSGMDYQALALEIMTLFINDIPGPELDELVRKSYATFDTDEVTPLVHDGKEYILELFHGPTLAFKDVALQFLGNLFSSLLAERNEKMNILGATSGDTGSAAIYGVKGRKNINIFILHPHGRVSPVQAMQMTTVPDANVFNIAVEGTFDDCQFIVKELFNDIPFKQEYRLGSINSINWARVLAQVVYYVYAALKLKKQGNDRVHFSVPTGNFGDIFAGYVAKKLISPVIDRLVLATNDNDILTRFILEGRYVCGTATPTISPSMDIQVASNFERYLYYLYGQDTEKVKKAMSDFSKDGKIIFTREELTQARKDFASASISQPQTVDTIGPYTRNLAMW
jgi:threonine synthase